MPYGKPPLRDVTCHVCATEFPVRRTGKLDEPAACPGCDAVIREAADDAARAALLAIVKTKASAQRIADLLAASSRDAAAVDELVDWLWQDYPPARARLGTARTAAKARLQSERKHHLARRRDVQLPPTPPLLEWARDVLARGDREGALEVLVLAWRTQRSSRIAAAIEALADHEPKRILRAEWNDRAGAQRAIDLDHLAAGFFVGPTPDPDHVYALSRWPADPRLAIILARVLVRVQPLRFGASRVYELKRQTDRLADRLVDLAIPRTVDMLEGHGHKDVRERIRAALRPDPVLSEADDRALAEIERTFAPVARRPRGALFDAVYAAPDDDAPRSLLADVLLEENDPRGEFIALQLSRAKRTAGAAARERQLIKRHGPDWAGAVGAVSKDLVFERGFPAIVKLTSPPAPTAFADPSWATVHTLELGIDMKLGKLADVAWVRDVRNLHICASRNLDGYDHAQLGLTRLVFDGYLDDWLATQLTAPGAFPHLTELHISPLTPEFFDVIRAAFVRLHSFACYPRPHDQSVATTDQLIRTIIERASAAPALRELRFYESDFDRPGWIYIVRRAGRTWNLELDRVPGERKISEPRLAPFDRCAAVTIVTTDKLTQRVRRSASRFVARAAERG